MADHFLRTQRQQRVEIALGEVLRVPEADRRQNLGDEVFGSCVKDWRRSGGPAESNQPAEHSRSPLDSAG